MQSVKPSIHIVAETSCVNEGINSMLREIGASSWDSNGTKGEFLIELFGRLCYKSFGTELNKNLTKVREGNHDYIANILKTKHGSVLEHATTTVAFINVSRIFTHELCRHRAGTAFSQESMRFVRLDNIPMYVPNLTEDFEELRQYCRESGGDRPDFAAAMQAAFEDYVRLVTQQAEDNIRYFNDFLNVAVPFNLKKRITSALRRMAPSGHATNIGMTANHRAWRHMIALRTDLSAEQEIREVFHLVAEDFKERYPALYQDMSPAWNTPTKCGTPQWVFSNEKV